MNNSKTCDGIGVKSIFVLELYLQLYQFISKPLPAIISRSFTNQTPCRISLYIVQCSFLELCSFNWANMKLIELSQHYIIILTYLLCSLVLFVVFLFYFFAILISFVWIFYPKMIQFIHHFIDKYTVLMWSAYKLNIINIIRAPPCSIYVRLNICRWKF